MLQLVVPSVSGFPFRYHFQSYFHVQTFSLNGGRHRSAGYGLITIFMLFKLQIHPPNTNKKRYKITISRMYVTKNWPFCKYDSLNHVFLIWATIGQSIIILRRCCNNPRYEPRLLGYRSITCFTCKSTRGQHTKYIHETKGYGRGKGLAVILKYEMMKSINYCYLSPPKCE